VLYRRYERTELHTFKFCKFSVQDYRIFKNVKVFEKFETVWNKKIFLINP